MSPDHRSHLLEVPGHELAKRFRVEPAAQRGRARKVGEEDGHDPPRLRGTASRSGQQRPHDAQKRDSAAFSPPHVEQTSVPAARAI